MSPPPTNPHSLGTNDGRPPPEKRRRVDDGPDPNPSRATKPDKDDDDMLFMDDDDDIFLDPHALAILTQADAQAQSTAAATNAMPPPLPPLPPTANQAPPTQHIVMSLPPGKQPQSYTGTTGSARAYHVSSAAGGGRIVAHLPPTTGAQPHAPHAGTAGAPDDATLRAEIARLEAQLQTRVGEAAMLRQKLATVQAEQRKAEADKREFEERVRAETEAKMANMMQELNKAKSEMIFQEHTIRESQRRVGRVQFSQAPSAAPASPMRSPAVLRSAISASGLSRLGLMRPPTLPMQPPPQVPKFGGSQFPPSFNCGAAVVPVPESVPAVPSEDRMDVDAMEPPYVPAPASLATEPPGHRSSSPHSRPQSPRPAKVDVATSPPSSPSIVAPVPPPVESQRPVPISYPRHILNHIHTLLQLLPTVQADPPLCIELLTSLTSPPPTSAGTLLPPLAQVLCHITPRLRKDPSEPIVRTALTTAHLAHWLARHSSNASVPTTAPVFDSRLVPAFLDAVCAAATFHFRSIYPPAQQPRPAPAAPTWPADLIPLLFSTLHLLATSHLPLPLPSTLSLLALPSSPYLSLAEPEYLAHARDWPAAVHLALAHWCQVVFAHGHPKDMLATKPPGRSLVSALVKLASRSPALHVVEHVLRAVHVLAARWPAQFARRWAAPGGTDGVEAALGLVVERVHREAHGLVYGPKDGHVAARARVVSVGLKIVYVLVAYCARPSAVVRLEQLLAPGASGGRAAEAAGVAGVWTQTRLMATLANVKRWVAEQQASKDEQPPAVATGVFSLKERVEARRRQKADSDANETNRHVLDLGMVAELEAAVGAVVVAGSTQTQQSLTQVTLTQTQTQVI